MSHEEIRKLLGGYATGTLTEAERKALFAAALEDQELFDELGREQSLKELLDSPGARTRLTAALAPALKERPWWRKPLPWALAGTLAAGAAVALVLLRTPHVQQIAMAPVASPEMSAPQAASRQESPRPAPLTAPTQPPGIAANRPESPRRDAAPERALKKADAVQEVTGNALDVNTQAREAKDAASDRSAQPVPPALAAPPPSPPQLAEGRIAGQPGAANGAPGVGGGGAAVSSFRGGVRGDLAQPRLAFDYTLRHDSLNVRPLANGFLLVTAVAAGGQQRVLQPVSRLAAGTSVTIAVPEGFPSLKVEFSARPPAQNPAHELSSSEPVKPGVMQATVEATPSAKVVPQNSAVPKEQTGRVEEPLGQTAAGASITLPVPPQ